MTINWDEIDWIRPTNNEIIEMSKGAPIFSNGFGIYTYQHMNWAAKETGVNRFYNMSCYPTGEDITMITFCARRLLRKRSLFGKNLLGRKVGGIDDSSTTRKKTTRKTSRLSWK